MLYGLLWPVIQIHNVVLAFLKWFIYTIYLLHLLQHFKFCLSQNAVFVAVCVHMPAILVIRKTSNAIVVACWKYCKAFTTIICTDGLREIILTTALLISEGTMLACVNINPFYITIVQCVLSYNMAY
jgi:hypothetical protein